MQYPLENEKEIYVSEVDPAAEAAHAKKCVALELCMIELTSN